MLLCTHMYNIHMCFSLSTSKLVNEVNLHGYVSKYFVMRNFKLPFKFKKKFHVYNCTRRDYVYESNLLLLCVNMLSTF